MINIMNINHTLFIQMANFLILLFILNLILYRPLFKKIRERLQTIEDMRKRADQLKSEAEKNLKEYSSKIKEAENSAKANYAKIVNETLEERERKISLYQKEALDEISGFEEEINKQIELEIESSKDYSIEIANKIYKQIME